MEGITTQNKYPTYNELINNPEYGLVQDTFNGKLIYRQPGDPEKAKWFYASRAEEAPNQTVNWPIATSKQADNYDAKWYNYNQPATMNYISQEIDKLAKQDEITQRLKQAKQKEKDALIEAVSWVPVVGEIKDLYDAGIEAYKGNYGTAAAGLGLMLLPEWAEKGVKKGGKWLKKYISNQKKYNFDSNTPDEVWDNAYNKAIQNNDQEAVQYLRDLHFKVKSGKYGVMDNNDQPLVLYHGTPYGNQTIMRPELSNATIGGSSAKGEKGIWLTPDLNSALRYAGAGSDYHPNIEEYTTPQTFIEKLKSSVGLYEQLPIHPINRIQKEYQVRPNKLKDYNQPILDREYATYDQTVYPLYVRGQSPVTFDFQGKPWSQYPGNDIPNKFSVSIKTDTGRKYPNNGMNIFDEETIEFANKEDAVKYFYSLQSTHGQAFVPSIKSLDDQQFPHSGGQRFIEMWSSYPTYNTAHLIETHVPKTTNGAVQTSFNNGNDLIHIKSVIDSNGGPGDVHYPIDDVIARKSEQIKLATPITYDDNGNIIPLSKRDNFNNPDIRYNWLTPLLIGGGTGALLYSNEKDEYKHGGKINRFG